MERIGRPGDDFREKLTRADIERICETHGLPRATEIQAESRGNETVCYHLDGRYFLCFVLNEDIKWKVEVLTLLHPISEMPTPAVVAWSSMDVELQVPYMVTERCPGHRLDWLWKHSGVDQRVSILEALGVGMGRYHTVSRDALVRLAQESGLEHRVQHIENPQGGGNEGPLTDCLPTLDARLRRIGIDQNGMVEKLQEHFARKTAEAGAFARPGLVHTEPFAEHFLVEHSPTGFRLSGCVDLNFGIQDSLGEITSHYVAMLCLDAEYLAAFRRGYEQFFALPCDAEERLRLQAVEHDLGNTLWLLDTMEARPEWGFAKSWVSGHVRRLCGWLDPSRRIDDALFREDIGPW